jgi:hypothetical protein
LFSFQFCVVSLLTSFDCFTVLQRRQRLTKAVQDASTVKLQTAVLLSVAMTVALPKGLHTEKVA